MKRIATIGMLLALLASSCGNDVTDATDPKPANLDGVWLVQLIDGSPVVEGTDPRLDITGNQVGGTTGCNTYGGNVSYADGTIGFSGLFWTEIGCEPDLMTQESTMLGILTAADRYTLVDELLTISGAGGSLELTPSAE